MFKQTLWSWSEDNAFRLAASLAYYAVFSLAPLLIIAIAIAGLFFDEALAREQVIDQVRMLIGDSGAAAVHGLLENAATSDSRGIASVMGMLLLMFGATGVIVSLQDGLNTIWQVKPKPMNFVIGFIRNRIQAVPLVLGVGFLLLVSLLLSAGIAAAGKFFGPGVAVPLLLEAGNFLLSIVTITVLFAMIFKLLPDVRIGWSDVWIGAFFTAVLFSLGKFAIGFYVGRSSFTSVYGAAASVVLILAWVYYSSLILFFGSEFTRVYASRERRRIVPKRHAEPIAPQTRAEEGLAPQKRTMPADVSDY
jgi:membrane protein